MEHVDGVGGHARLHRRRQATSLPAGALRPPAATRSPCRRRSPPRARPPCAEARRPRRRFRRPARRTRVSTSYGVARPPNTTRSAMRFASRTMGDTSSPYATPRNMSGAGESSKRGHDADPDDHGDDTADRDHQRDDDREYHGLPDHQVEVVEPEAEDRHRGRCRDAHDDRCDEEHQEHIRCHEDEPGLAVAARRYPRRR